MLLLLVAAAAGLAAWLDRMKPSSKFWWTIAVIGLLASIDEGAATHEFSLQTIHNFVYGDISPSLLVNAWLVVLPLLATLAFLLARWGWRVLPKKTFWLFMAGGAVFMIGAVFFDWLISDVDPATYLSQGILVAMEETLEMVGTAIIIYAILGYLEVEHKAKISQALSRLG
jgi:drug/metabolite transporter superfamily protein YnfA